MTATVEHRPAQLRRRPPCGCARSARRFGTGPDAVTALRRHRPDRARRASSSACSARRAAASRRCSTSSPGWTSRPPARSTSARRGRRLMFQESALLPWLTAGRNVELPLQLRRRRPAGAAGARPSGCWRSSGSTGRAASGRTSCPAACGSGSRSPGRWPRRPGRRAGPPADGRAVRRARRDHPRRAAGRAHRASGRATGTTIVFVTHDVREAVRLGAAGGPAVLAARPRRARVGRRPRAHGRELAAPPRSPPASDR